jgi:hypothetical protein
LEVERFTGSNDWTSRFKRRQDTVKRTLAGESRIADTESVDGWKND